MCTASLIISLHENVNNSRLLFFNLVKIRPAFSIKKIMTMLGGVFENNTNTKELILIRDDTPICSCNQHYH